MRKLETTGKNATREVVYGFQPGLLVEWSEPFSSDGDEHLICRMTFADVATYQKRHVKKITANFKYKSDAHAVDDFIVIHWASVINSVTNKSVEWHPNERL